MDTWAVTWRAHVGLKQLAVDLGQETVAPGQTAVVPSGNSGWAECWKEPATEYLFGEMRQRRHPEMAGSGRESSQERKGDDCWLPWLLLSTSLLLWLVSWGTCGERAPHY